MQKPIACTFASFAVVILALAPARSAADDFVTACGRGGARSMASCKCQARLARSSLDAAEMHAMIVGMSGDKAAIGAVLEAMGAAKAKAFVAKIRGLDARVASACP